METCLKILYWDQMMQRQVGPKSPAALAFNSQRNSHAEEKLDVIEREAKEDNRKHAAKVAEEVATMISRVPEYVFDAYEDGCQGDGGSLVEFTTIEKEAIE
ncbi:uncharacterized protein LOC124193802 isoform X1 [Daphnia pulex]|uniref:uncharacterized protein LOC124193802 isoform X1 n=1 Tax=Daphnia pulex TaxID=6669 RepID=UPI001EDF3B26|nr:uncharacterized protein LOC124193802 isoform X1 [Daphnia pulex]